MKRKKIIIYLLIIVSIINIIILIYHNEKKNDVLSLSPRSGALNVSSEFLSEKKAVEFYRSEIEKHPDVIKNYIELAQIFLQEARVTGNHHEYIKKASMLIENAEKQDPGNFDVMMTKASILMTLHQFKSAKGLIEKAVKMNNFSAAAFGILCDADVELGLYDEAVKACDKMLSIRPDLRSYSRASYVREIYGDVNGAIEAMTLAVKAGVPGQESRSWVLYNLANLYLQSGKIDTAAYIFNGILEERPGYANAYCGLSDVYTARKNYGKAIEYLVKAAQIAPEHIYIEKLADIYKALDQKESEEEMIKKVLDAFELHKKDGYNVDLEYARFCLDHNINLNEALESARSEYNRRPGNIDALEVYSWALYKTHKAGEALPYIQKAMRFNTKRISLFYHAGMIYNSTDMHTEAVQNFEKVFKSNAYINPLFVENNEGTQNLTAGLSYIK